MLPREEKKDLCQFKRIDKGNLLLDVSKFTATIDACYDNPKKTDDLKIKNKKENEKAIDHQTKYHIANHAVDCTKQLQQKERIPLRKEIMKARKKNLERKQRDQLHRKVRISYSY
ncbi:MAG: hypothetical protein LBI77_00405 [Puniceicoccales bacterium]|nr:hypothetical protein [Puniceicoccales bacterium]